MRDWRGALGISGASSLYGSCWSHRRKSSAQSCRQLGAASLGVDFGVLAAVKLLATVFVTLSIGSWISVANSHPLANSARRVGQPRQPTFYKDVLPILE